MHRIAMVLFLTASAFAANAPRPQEFPTFGFSVVPPEGWTAMECENTGMAARWGLTDRDSRTTTATLWIELYPLQGKTFVSLAAAIGRPMKEREPEEGVIAGAPCLLLRNRTKDAGKEEMPLRMAMVTRQGEIGYVVRLHAKDEAAERAGAAALEKIRASWAFRTFEAPSAHLKTLEMRTMLGRFQMAVPACMRPIQAFGGPKGGEHLAAFNFAANGPACMMNVDLVGEALGDVAERRRNFAVNLRQRFGLAADPTWSVLPGQPPRSMTSPIDMPLSPIMPPSRMFYAIVDLGQTHAVILFSINAADAQAAKAWSDAAEAMVRSIQQPAASK